MTLREPGPGVRKSGSLRRLPLDAATIANDGVASPNDGLLDHLLEWRNVELGANRDVVGQGYR